MQALKNLWRRIADHERTHALLRFIFNCKSYADIDARAVAIRLSIIVTVATLVCLALSFPLNWDLGWSYREGYPMTMMSVFFLFAIGHICLKIHRELGINAPSAALWKILGISFIFLAFDDWLRIHESTDHLIHKIFRIKETTLTDHLDDAIVVAYAAAIAVVLYRGRKELWQFRAALPYFIPAMIFAVGHCVVDFVGGTRSWISAIIASPDTVEAVIIWAEIVEETFKLGAGVFLIATCVRCYTLVRDRSVSIEKRTKRTVTRMDQAMMTRPQANPEPAPSFASQ